MPSLLFTQNDHFPLAKYIFIELVDGLTTPAPPQEGNLKIFAPQKVRCFTLFCVARVTKFPSCGGVPGGRGGSNINHTDSDKKYSIWIYGPKTVNT